MNYAAVDIVLLKRGRELGWLVPMYCRYQDIQAI
jgi:hypothetical protein